MSVDQAVASEQWYRYVYLRDNGHLDFIEKANKCDAYYLGQQWTRADKAILEAQRRPALTINKILPTIDTVVGEQINTRVDFAFKPRRPGQEDLSSVIEQVFKVILDDNQYQWKETEVAEDGFITSRGYLDTRLKFTENMQGEVEMTVLNPRNVLPDCDAEEFDPATWNDVLTTKWLSPLDIELLYNKDDADWLRFNDPAMYSQEFDSVYRQFETFRTNPLYRSIVPVNREMRRDIRVLERQFRQVVKTKMFVDMVTGEMREVPENWSREKIGLVMQKFGVGVTEVMAKRIRWRVTAGPCVLHDDWSPYDRFTVVPYFPHFRRGKTMGLVENLLSPQEMLNKISSQELHVVNTTANSGWKIKQGGLRNMTIPELEQRGAQTGVVLELGDTKDAEKIEPNQIPSGLERMSYKAEEHIKTISTVTDNAMGQDREDVAAKAIRAKREVNVISRARIMDNLNRFRHLVAENVLSIIQRYYSEPRIYRVIKDEFTGETAELQLNNWDETLQRVTNDLTLGEYDVVITTTPNKDSVMESEFEQALSMRELGLPIGDEVLIRNSNLKSKREIVRNMQAQAQSAEAQQAAAMENQAKTLELERMDAENDKIRADALLKTSNAKRNVAEMMFPAPEGGPKENPLLEQQRMEHETEQQAAEHQLKREEMGLKREELAFKAHEQAQSQAHEAGMARLGQAQEVQKAQLTHAAKVKEAQLGHQQTVEQSREQHKQSLAQTKAAAKARPKPTTKPKGKK